MPRAFRWQYRWFRMTCCAASRAVLTSSYTGLQHMLSYGQKDTQVRVEVKPADKGEVGPTQVKVECSTDRHREHRKLFHNTKSFTASSLRKKAMWAPAGEGARQSHPAQAARSAASAASAAAWPAAPSHSPPVLAAACCSCTHTATPHACAMLFKLSPTSLHKNIALRATGARSHGTVTHNTG